MSGYNLNTYDGSIMTIEAGALVIRPPKPYWREEYGPFVSIRLDPEVRSWLLDQLAEREAA